MITSSPLSAASISLDRLVLAAWIVICMIGPFLYLAKLANPMGCVKAAVAVCPLCRARLRL